MPLSEMLRRYHAADYKADGEQATERDVESPNATYKKRDARDQLYPGLDNSVSEAKCRQNTDQPSAHRDNLESQLEKIPLYLASLGSPVFMKHTR